MKQIYIYLTALFLLSAATLKASGGEGAEYDSLRVSLLTCSPHDEVYSLYGHTAIRVENKSSGEDFVINYGVFSFDKPFFLLRFVFGLTDYEMGILPYDIFLREYAYYGSSVTEQEIAFTTEEKLRFMAAAAENYREPNRVYRYNYFYDNCTTRARDIIVGAVEGMVVYNDSVPEGLTFRKMIHSKTENNPWARLGNDLLLGVGADRQLTLSEMQFLPQEMLVSADSAYILLDNGEKRRLVSRTTTLLKERGGERQEKTVEPVWVGGAILLLTMMLSFVEWRKKWYLWWYDTLLFLLCGLCGIILTAMIFSQHPTVSLNAQILLFNPLLLVYGIIAVRKFRKGDVHWFWLLEILMLCLLLVVFSFEIQWIDPSVRLLTLSLLLRSALKIRYRKEMTE